MLATMKPVLEMTARDLMTAELVCLPAEMSMREAARLLLQNRISGAPVVDARGKCIGVISNTDFVALAERSGTHTKTPHICSQPSCVCTDWEVVEVKSIPLDAVRRHMTADPVMVAPSTPIGELARQMIDAHIHRIVVIDERQKPIGIVTSTDLLAALARAEGHA